MGCEWKKIYKKSLFSCYPLSKFKPSCLSFKLPPKHHHLTDICAMLYSLSYIISALFTRYFSSQKHCYTKQYQRYLHGVSQTFWCKVGVVWRHLERDVIKNFRGSLFTSVNTESEHCDMVLVDRVSPFAMFFSSLQKQSNTKQVCFLIKCSSEDYFHLFSWTMKIYGWTVGILVTW